LPAFFASVSYNSPPILQIKPSIAEISCFSKKTSTFSQLQQNYIYRQKNTVKCLLFENLYAKILWL